MNPPGDSWGHRDPPPHQNGPPSYSTLPSPRRSNGAPHHQHTYASMGSYASMNRGHPPPQQQWHHGHGGRDHRLHGEGCHEGEFRRQNSNPPSFAKMPMCKFFQRGHCRDGNSCRFRHEQPQNDASDYYGRPEDRDRHDIRSKGCDRHADNRSVNSEKSGLDEFGRPNSAKNGEHRSNEGQSQNPIFSRSDSNRSMGSNKSVSNFGDTDACSSKWSKIRLNDKPVRKSSDKASSNAESNATEKSSKKIKWGQDKTDTLPTLNYCNKPGHQHLWSECPENQFSKNYIPPTPKLTDEQTNAMFRAALENSGTFDKPTAAPPNAEARSINSLNACNLKNNALRKPPTVKPSSSAKPAATLTGTSIPRRNLAATQQFQRKNSSELERKGSLRIDTAAPKLNAAGQLKSPTPQNGRQKKVFVPRSQRAMAKRPSPDQATMNNKKRKRPTTLLTSPVGRQKMTPTNGGWKKVSADAAPLANDAVALTKHKSSRILSKKINPFDALDRDDESDVSSKEETSDHDGINVDFDSDAEDDSARKHQSYESQKIKSAARTKSPEVICLDSSSDEDDELDDQAEIPTPTEKEKKAETAATRDGVEQDEPIQGISTSFDASEPLAQESIESNTHDGGKFMEVDVSEEIDPPRDNPSSEVAMSFNLNAKEVHNSNNVSMNGSSPCNNDEIEAAEKSADIANTEIEKGTCTRAQHHQQHHALNDEQMDEMESDFLDWAVCCAKSAASHSPGPTDDALTNDDSTVSEGSTSDNSEDDDEMNGTESIENSPRNTNGKSGSRSDKNLSIYTTLNRPQRAGSSSVTPSPLAANNEGLVDGDFQQYHTCDKCSLVFLRYEDASNHEIDCSASEGELGPVFHDDVELSRYINLCTDRKCYFKPLPSAADTPPNKNWDLMYDAIKKFHRDHGHLNLPYQSTNPQLGNLNQWLETQIEKMRQNALQPDRKTRIKEILGADSNAGRNVSSKPTGEGKKKTWEKRYIALKKFFKEQGHLNLPDLETPGLGNLRKWLISQKNKLNAGNLSKKHANKLKKLLGLEDGFCVMQSVEHLSSKDLSSGFPKQTIVVIDTFTDILHQFQTEVRQSGIVNAGNGVFLTYLGAKVLNREASAKSSRLVSKHVQVDSLTNHPLPAVDHYRRRMTVRITPNTVFTNENNNLLSKKRCAALDEHNKNSPNDDFNEHNFPCSVHDEVQSLRSGIPVNERIGQLGINSIADYVEDDNISFWSHDKIELGRYGPFRPEDRKPELHLNMKNFLFDYEPMEWAYEIEGEEEYNRKMMIDITDDTTGQVHDLAKQYSSIYVNEVGHRPDLHENVSISVNGDAGAVYYYISIDEQHAMKKGDTVELLVNYGNHYEDVRERKGYGLKNKEGLGHDAEDKAAKLQRNFSERREAEHEIVDLSFFKLWFLVDFLTEKVYGPIKKSMELSISNPRHVIAMRRLHWLAKPIKRRLEVLLQIKAKDKTDMVNISPMMSDNMVDELRSRINAWEFVSRTINSEVLQAVMANGGMTVKEAIREEISEELFFEASCKVSKTILPNPLDESVWSNIAIRLMKHSAVNIASYLFTESNFHAEMAKILVKAVFDSSNAVRKAARIINGSEESSETSFDRAVSFLCFKSRAKQDRSNTSLLPDKSIYDSAPVPYDEAAFLAEYQVYHDAIDLCPFVSSSSKLEVGSRRIDSQRTIISKYASDQQSHSEKQHQFHWMPRYIDAFRKRVAKVHTEWYLIHHVVLVVHALASLVDWSNITTHDGLPLYSIEMLCNEAGVDRKKVEEAISFGFVLPTISRRSPLKSRKAVGSPSKPKRLGKRSSPRSPASRKTKAPKAKTRKSAKKKINTPSAGTPGSRSDLSSFEHRILHDGPDDNFPGWNVRGVRRQTGTHVDKYWYRPEYRDIVIRSQTGVNAINNTMKEKGMDFVTACIHLSKKDGKAYFLKKTWEKKYS